MRVANVVLVALILVLGSPWAPATADEVEVRAEESSFDWTGKQEGIAAYEWAAVVHNPGRRSLEVEVRLELLDDADGVIASEAAVVVLEPEERTEVGGRGSLPYPEARRAARFRIALRAPDESLR